MSSNNQRLTVTVLVIGLTIALLSIYALMDPFDWQSPLVGGLAGMGTVVGGCLIGLSIISARPVR